MEDCTTFVDDYQFNRLGGDMFDDGSDSTEMEIFDSTQTFKALNTPSVFNVSHTFISKSC